MLLALLFSFAFVASPQTHTFPALVTNNSFAGANSFPQQITSTVATGTAPFSVSSTTKAEAGRRVLGTQALRKHEPASARPAPVTFRVGSGRKRINHPWAWYSRCAAP